MKKEGIEDEHFQGLVSEGTQLIPNYVVVKVNQYLISSDQFDNYVQVISWQATYWGTVSW